MTEAQASPSGTKVLHPTSRAPVYPQLVWPSATSTPSSPPYGPHSTVPRQLHASVPPHLADPTRTSVKMLLDNTTDGQAPADRGAGLPTVNPRQQEAFGLFAIPQKKHVAEPEHRVFTANDKVQEANMRYHNGAYRRSKHAETHSKLRTDSLAVHASLDERVPPAPATLVAEDGLAGHKGGIGGARSVHRSDRVGLLLVGLPDGPEEAQPTPAKPEAVMNYLGTGVRETLAGDRAGSDDVKYGWGMYGVHKERQSSVGGSESGRRHYVTSTLKSDGVANTLAHEALVAAMDAQHAAPTVRPVTAAAPRTAAAAAAERSDAGSTPAVERSGTSGPKGGNKEQKYERELRGSTAAELFHLGASRAPFATAEASPFETTYRGTFVGSREGGPRSKTPPKRHLAPVYGGANDPFRVTQIY